jgi:hypothetical protein
MKRVDLNHFSPLKLITEGIIELFTDTGNTVSIFVRPSHRPFQAYVFHGKEYHL